MRMTAGMAWKNYALVVLLGRSCKEGEEGSKASENETRSSQKA